MTRLISLLVVSFFTAAAFAQTAPTQPAKTEHLKATVTGVEGLVQVRASEKEAWQKAAVGMVVGENAEFRTGPKSAVQFVLPPDQVVTLDRLGTVKVLEAIDQNGKLKTQLGMKYGRTRYEIEAAGQEHESSIASPSSTLAVRGTVVSLLDQRPFPAEATSLTGRAEFRDMHKRVFFGNHNAGKTVVDTSNANSAAYAIGQTVIDPSIALARSQADTALVDELLSTGATVSFDYLHGIRVVRGGKVPQTDSALIPTLPNTLDFVLRWQGNTDLNLGVTSPGNGKNQTVYPLGGFNLIPSGGSIAFDHRGGPNGGIEIASWPANYPTGRYLVAAQLINGPDTPATLDVFLNGQRLPITTSQGSVTTAHFIGEPVNPEISAPAVAIGAVQVDSSTIPGSRTKSVKGSARPLSVTPARLSAVPQVMGPSRK